VKFRATPLQDWTGRLLNSERPVYVKRDDLLPFPLPGNKVRKLSYELKGVASNRTVVVTVGSVHSNHCRTTALMCAQRGVRSHFVLHDDGADPVMSAAGTRMMGRLGASYEIVVPDDIRHAVEAAVHRFEDEGCIVHVIEGGCHTPAGVEAYEDAAKELARQVDEEPGYIFLASGTGATQAGLAVGCAKLGWSTSVVGISVARLHERGLEAVLQAVEWRGERNGVNTAFTDNYRAGGYGKSDDHVRDAVDRAWRVGLPVDPVYTGKALAGLIDMDESEVLEMPGPIVFWHTGGIFQATLKDL
jgi:1-aminocyclopropane-1-carboxylate deaminase/D-cysteine desulfhydrase-like pyridoxal-dependent ACC family enzyme